MVDLASVVHMNAYCLQVYDLLFADDKELASLGSILPVVQYNDRLVPCQLSPRISLRLAKISLQ